MEEILQRILAEIKAGWRYRWWALLAAWGICLVSWLGALSIPDEYEARSVVFVDVSSRLDKVIGGVTIEWNMQEQLDRVRQEMLSRRVLAAVARATDLDLRATTPERMSVLLDSLQQRIVIEDDRRSLAARDPRIAGDSIFRIRFSDRSRDTALAVVQNLLDMFVRDVTRGSQAESDDAQTFLSRRIAEYEDMLRQREQALAAVAPLLQQTLTDPRVLQLFEAIDLAPDAVSAEALSLSAQMRQASPDSPVPDILAARVHSLRQEYGEAAEAYDAAASRGGGRYAVVGSYLANRQAGDAAAARTVLEGWLENNPDDATLRVMLAAGYLGSGELGSAAAEYERLLDEEGRDPAVLNNLAWLYGELGDERAIQLAREAYRAAPENASIIDTLGWLLVQDGQLEEGIDMLRDAVRRAPTVQEIRFHLATALNESGAVDEANRILGETLAPEPAGTGDLPGEE